MHGLRTLCFDVPDLAAATRFYTEVIGHGPYFDAPFYVGFDVEGYELGLRPAEGERRAGAGGAVGYLGVDDVDAEVTRLVALGAKVREAPEDVGEGIRVATLVDPFGNVLGLIRNLGFAPPLVAARADDLSSKSIDLEVAAPIALREAWRLWSTTEGVTRWFVTEAKIELRPGGPYEVYFLLDRPRGSRGSEGCRVLSFVPERMLSFTWNAPPHLAKTRNLHTWVVVTFAEASGGTRVGLSHLGWPASGLRDEAEWRATYDYFARAWRRVLDDFASFARTGERP